MKVRAALVAAALLVVAGGVAAAFMLFGHHGAHHPDTVAGSATRSGGGRSSASPAQARQAAQAAAALQSLATDPAKLVATGARTQVAGRARQAVPAGSVVAPDARSWAPDGIGGGTMLVTLTSPGQPGRTFAAVMVTEHGAWKVLATFPVTGSRAVSAQPTASSS